MSAKQTPEERRTEELRAAMHRWVDDVCDLRPVILRIADEMAGGISGGGLGQRGGAVEGGTTAALAVSAVDDPRWDPAVAARDWEAHRVEAFGHVRNLASEGARLKPMSKWLAEHRTDDDEGICEACRQPVLAERDLETGETTRVIDKYGRIWHRDCMPDDVDVCVECGQLASETEILRVRGVFAGIVHARELGTGCYWRVYNRITGRRAAASE